MAEPSQIDAPAESNPRSPSVQPDEKSDTGGKPGEEIIAQLLTAHRS